MSKGVQAVVDIVVAAVYAYLGDYGDAAVWAGKAYTDWRGERDQVKQKRAFNASLRDRYAMVQSSTSPRQLVFGRCRVGGSVFFVQSYGANREHLSLCIALAAHEVDAIETVYFDDRPIQIDGSGNVTGIVERESFTIDAATGTFSLQQLPRTGTVSASARYGANVVALTVTSVTGLNVSVSGAHSSEVGQLDIFYLPDAEPYGQVQVIGENENFAVTTATQSFTLAYTPIAGSVVAAINRTDVDSDSYPVTVDSVVGNVVTCSGMDAWITDPHDIGILYQTTTSTGNSQARVRKYLGAPGQTADAGLIAAFPGVWTSAHTATGVAYLVVELDYSDNAFSTGVPRISAVVRGMKCYDPRSSTTVWTENPALHVRAIATHPLAGNLPDSAIDDASVIQAANVCDTSTTYTLGDTDYVRPLYTSGYSIKTDSKPTDGLTEVCTAMGGGWVFANGQLRVSAGAYRTPVLSIDESWLVGDSAVGVTAAIPRTQLVNTVTASYADQYEDYRVIPMPRISPSTYLTEDGTTLATDTEYAAVTFAGQAQYLASCVLRKMRQGLTVTLNCNLRAWRAERFDVVSVSLARFGWVNKPFEVIEDTWTTDGSISLTLRETAAEIYDMDIGFPAYDLAPNTNLPVAWGLPKITGLAALSGNDTYLQQADGTVVTRILVTWDPVTDARILVGGQVEVQFWRVGDADPTYQTAFASGDATSMFLDVVNDGASYLITARTVSTVTESVWCAQILHEVTGKDGAPPNVTGLAETLGSGRVHLTWGADTLDDYKLTELRYGTTWAGGALIGQVAGTALDWLTPPVGSQTVWAAHQNTSLVYSASPASITFTVTGDVDGYTYALGFTPLMVLQGDYTGHVTDYSAATTTVEVLKNGVDDTSNWTLAKADTTVTSTLSSGTLSITAIPDANDSGYVTITATRTNYTTLTARLTVSKTRGAPQTSVVNPMAPYFVAADNTTPATAIAGIRLNTDGTSSSKVNSGSYTVVTAWNWYLPPTTGIGSSYWVRLHKTSGDALSFGTLDTWIALSSAVAWELSTGGIAKTFDGTIAIALDSAGATVVATGTVHLEAESS